MEPNYSKLVSDIKASFKTGKTKSYEWRRSQLLATVKLLDENRERLIKALRADLGKCHLESVIDEIDFSIGEANCALRQLSDWMKPQPVERGLANAIGQAYIRYEPFGVVLNISAWNYPLQLSVCPLIAAVASGNCVVVKPSELSDNTTLLLAELFPKYYDQECICLVRGGIPESTALLKEQWDHIMYTGNSQVAKVIASAAATYLTPTTLELGGKSPTYVDGTCNLAVTASRVVWGKFKNAGQTCIAPDYVICTPEVQDALCEELKKAVLEQYGSNPEASPDYARIVSDRHFRRVITMLKNATSPSVAPAKVVCGNSWTEGSKYIAPTILSHVSLDNAVMQEEIFGPVLPVVAVKSYSEAIDLITAREKPLAVYVFSNSKTVANAFLERTSSGSIVINDCLLQAALRTLPFGGVGNSGMGHYHGWYGFANFSHKKSCLIKDQGALGEYLFRLVRYPPYTDRKLWLTGFFVNDSSSKGIPMYILLGILAVIGAVVAIFIGRK